MTLTRLILVTLLSITSLHKTIAQNTNPFYTKVCEMSDVPDVCSTFHAHSVCQLMALDPVTGGNDTTTEGTDPVPPTDANDTTTPAGNDATTAAPAVHIDVYRCRCPEGYIPYNSVNPDDPTGPCVNLEKFFSTTCNPSTGATDCNIPAHMNAVCALRNKEQSTVDNVMEQNDIFMCRCNDNYMFMDDSSENVTAGRCIIDAGLNEMCDIDLSECSVANTGCYDDGSNQGTSRCMCESGYEAFTDTDNDTTMCARIIKAQDHDICVNCETNGGTCLSTTSNVTALETDPEHNYECKCPVTKVQTDDGVDCGKSLVNVICDVSSFTMTICYEPHEDITNDDFLLYADEYGTQESCKGFVIEELDDTNDCPDGSKRKLVLELKSELLSQCGVQRSQLSQSILFHKTLVIKNDSSVSDSSSDGNYYFDVYCQMATQIDSGFNAFGVRGVPGNDQGQELEPSIDFRLYNALDQELSEGVVLRLGDQMSFEIDLEADGTYAAIHVLRCTASTSPKIPDDDADTAVLMLDSCPAPSQQIFTIDNVWRQVGGQPNRLKTGLVPAFKLPRGSDVFMHCTVRLCLEGEEETCAPVACDGVNSAGKRRRRRETNNEMDVVRQITITETEEDTSDKIVMNTTGFALMITVLLVILVILTALVALLFIKLRRRGNYVEEIGSPPDKPQRFALPRIGNAAMRM